MLDGVTLRPKQREILAYPGGRMGDLETWTREQVVAALVLGARLATMREVPAGGWVKLEDVRLVSVGDDLFVRTGGGKAVGDNLGDIMGGTPNEGESARSHRG